MDHHLILEDSRLTADKNSDVSALTSDYRFARDRLHTLYEGFVGPSGSDELEEEQDGLRDRRRR